ncbi:WAT1-related protein [Quillaja saponaria]|uniref:WAT1-related protein n=1 Tax=Quillaja saponaria TaxID=32244 RepID=A0AAD7Q445_QUISA|nr:WAT1-related protein [Quillaja saponaria]
MEHAHTLTYRKKENKERGREGEREREREREMAWRQCYQDVVPFSAMVAAECCLVCLNILFKLASLNGLSYYVFIVYTYVLSTLVLLPFAYINFRRSTGLPSFKWSLLNRIFLLGLLGMEKVAIRSSSTQAKIMGTIVSISGALLVVLYKGPIILSTPSLSPSPSLSLHYPLQSSQTNWILGGLLLTAGYLLLSVCYIVQTQAIKSYPAELIVVLLYNLCGIFISAPACLLAETNWSAWKLSPDISLVAILYSGSIAIFATVAHAWGMHLKGPVYVTSFKPLSIAIAAAMSVIFLGDDLHLGSVVGAVILSAGFYAVIWGKVKEEDLHEDYECDSLGSSYNAKTPLLPSFKPEDV